MTSIVCHFRRENLSSLFLRNHVRKDIKTRNKQCFLFLSILGSHLHKPEVQLAEPEAHRNVHGHGRRHCLRTSNCQVIIFISANLYRVTLTKIYFSKIKTHQLIVRSSEAEYILGIGPGTFLRSRNRAKVRRDHSSMTSQYFLTPSLVEFNKAIVMLSQNHLPV